MISPQISSFGVTLENAENFDLIPPFSKLPKSVRKVFYKIKRQELSISKVSWDNISMENAILLAIFIIEWCSWIKLEDIPEFIIKDNRFVNFLLNLKK